MGAEDLRQKAECGMKDAKGGSLLAGDPGTERGHFTMNCCGSQRAISGKTMRSMIVRNIRAANGMMEA